MLTIEKFGIILSPTDREFEKHGVLNPAVYQDGNTVHFFYRAVQFGNLSTIGYAKSEDPFNIVERHEKPLIEMNHEYEKHGVEDARIVKIDDTFYMTYTAYNGPHKYEGNIRTAKQCGLSFRSRLD